MVGKLQLVLVDATGRDGLSTGRIVAGIAKSADLPFRGGLKSKKMKTPAMKSP
jgi:hypothetical protein